MTRLSAGVRSAFPEARGFSPRNLRYMRSFAAAWPDFPMLQQAVATLPWGHNVILLDKLQDSGARLWYAAAAVENGWSRNVLAHHIETKLHERSGKAITNFKEILPQPDADLAQQSFKDAYVFDFVAVTDRRLERELEGSLLSNPNIWARSTCTCQRWTIDSPGLLAPEIPHTAGLRIPL